MKRFCVVLLCLLFCAASVRSQTAEQKQATIAYLQGLQATDGGFLPAQPRAQDRSPRSSLRATSGALRALKYFGGEPKDKEECLRFVQKCCSAADGGFADYPGGKIDVATTAVGLMALVELKAPLDDFRKTAVDYLAAKAKTFEEIRIAAAGLEAVHERPAQADVWLEQLARMRHPDGTYGKGDGMARATGGAVVAVLRLGGQVEHRDEVVKVLKAGQRADGAFGKEGTPTSDLDTSYRVMRAFHMLKTKPDAERLREFIGRCRNADGGYGVAPGQSSQVGSTYYAATILHWLADDNSSGRQAQPR
jgi:prenyltransferase beta subunit